ncbi:peptidoglycan/LPS O-acetylase OafA/YrhL [Rhizobium leguminosarum]
MVSAAFLVFVGFKYGMLNIGWEWPSAVGGLPRVMFSFTAGVVISRLFGGMPAWRKGWAAIVPCLLLMICIAAPVPVVLRPYYDLMFAMALAPLIVMLGLFLEMPAKKQRRWRRGLGISPTQSTSYIEVRSAFSSRLRRRLD